MRAIGAGIAIVGLGLAGGSYAVWAGGGIAAPTFVAAAAAGVVLLGGGIGYVLRNQVTLGGSVLTITNLWRTYRIPTEKIVGAVLLRSGVAVRLDDGRAYRARAFEPRFYGRWEIDQSRSVAKEAVGEVMAAAEQAREDRGLDLNPPKPPSAKVGIFTRLLWNLGFEIIALNLLCWAVVFTQIFKR